MNVSLMKYIPNSVTTKVGRSALQASKHSPTILFATGMVGFVATTVLASRATLKLETVLESTKENLDAVHKLREADREDYTEEDAKKDTAYIYAAAAVDITKLYAPVVLVGFVSVACLTKSHTILNKRNAGLTAAYTALDKAFTEYRGRVAKEFGDEKEREFRYGIEQRTVEDTTGKEVVVRRVDPNKISGYAKFFDESNPNWNRNPDYNFAFIRSQQNYANNILQVRGHVFLNEIYDSLGFERTSAGAVVGWVISKEGDNFIDFGLFNGGNPMAVEFINGNEPCILLDFNVDGVIYDKTD